MMQTSHPLHIQVNVPGQGQPRFFPLDGGVRFSDLFRTLIDEGCFSAAAGEKPVWVLLCGNEDLVTWNSASGSFFDRFPFGEPPIAGIPGWKGQPVRFVSYPEPLARAKSLFRYFQGSKFFMGHEGFLTEYKSYNVPPELEARWREEN